jgi:hypothetical protein
MLDRAISPRRLGRAGEQNNSYQRRVGRRRARRRRPLVGCEIMAPRTASGADRDQRGECQTHCHSYRGDHRNAAVLRQKAPRSFLNSLSGMAVPRVFLCRSIATISPLVCLERVC